jgi:hypothetical protein
MPHTTVHRILWKRLKFNSYKYQRLQHVNAQDKVVHYTFCSDFLSRLEDDEHFTAKIVLSDKATFHLSGNGNRHDLRIWGSNNPHKVKAHTTDSQKLNVSCTLFEQNVFGHFFFADCALTGIVHLNILEEFLMPILEEQGPDNLLFQQDGAPPHFHREVTDFLNHKFLKKQSGRGGPITWPPHLIDLTPPDFLFCGYIKNAV